MGQNSKKVRDFEEAARLDAYNAFRKDVDPGRIGLALQAIRQRVDQDLMVSIAAYEIDCTLTNKNHRIKRNPNDSLPDIISTKARLDVIDQLMLKYENEYLEAHPEVKDEIEQELKDAIASAEAEDAVEWGDEEQPATESEDE